METKSKKKILVQQQYPVETVFDGVLESFTSLGKEIKLSPKSKVSIFKPGVNINFPVGSVDLLIGIGNDHTAYLIMSAEALAALKSGANVEVKHLKAFKETIK